MGIFSKSTAPPPEPEIDLSEVTDEPIFSEDVAEQQELERKRNKSRLEPGDRKRLFDERPYNKSLMWYHDTVRYKKRMLGRYGMDAVDVTPGVAWPTQEKVADAKEYERVAFPITLHQEWARIAKAKAQREAEMRARDAEVAAKVAKTEKWIQDLKKRIEKKEKELAQSKERRQKVLAEIKHELKLHFVDQHDAKVKALIAQKEKVYKKQMKEEKKKLREEKMKNRHAAKQAEADDDSVEKKPEEN